MTSSLRTQLTAMVVLVVVIPFLVYTPLAALRASQMGREDVLKLQHQISRTATLEIETAINETVEDIEEIIHLRNFAGGSLAEKENLLAALLMSTNSYDEISLYDAGGNELITVERASVGKLHDHSLRSEYLVPLNDGVVYYGEVEFQELGEPYIEVGFPVEDLRTGEVVEVIIANIRFKPVWNLIATLDLETDHQVYVTNEDGRVIAHADPSIVLQETIFDIPATDSIGTGLMGERVILSREDLQLGNRSFTIVAEIPVERALVQTRQNVLLMSVVGIGAGVGAGVVSFLLLGRIVKPLEDLSQTAAAIANGDLDRRAAAKGKDEIGQLAASFNHMANRVEANVAELQEYQTHLETLVDERTAQLQAVNKELTDFAYVVSHDLKAPLRGVTQLANWLQVDYSHAIDDEGQHMLNLMVGRARRMHEMIEGILQYSRIGRLRAEHSSIDLDTLVNNVVELLAPPSHVIIKVDDLPTVTGVEILIQQVFQNLIENAIKYVDRADAHITISSQQNPAHWQFAVTDNGPGIEPKYHEKIFRIFQSLHDEDDSTGIGLALVKKIVEAHNGQVWLESTIGEGTTFYFTLAKEGTTPNHAK